MNSTHHPWATYAAAVLMLAIACPNAGADEVDDLLANKPVYTILTPAQLLDESPAQRLARLEAYEIAHRDWVDAMAKVLDLELEVESQTSAPTGNDTAPSFPSIVRLVDFTETGTPVYQGTDNIEAGISTHAAYLRTGIPGLDGTGEIVSVVDVRLVREDHQEFIDVENQTRVTRMESLRNGNHATHVAGTIAAGGVQAEATGMAPRALIQTWDNTGAIRKLTGSVSTSLTDYDRPAISNHSYGYRVTWDFRQIDGQNTDAWHWEGNLDADLESIFGSYTIDSRMIDEFAFTNPSHLYVTSAGNYRRLGPQEGDTFYYRDSARRLWQNTTYDPAIHPGRNDAINGGFTTIPPAKATKNTLVVGNFVQAGSGIQIRTPERAEPNPSSSIGPTRDGRIKPDVVGNGTEVISPTAAGTASYDEYSGTSMATPNVAGTALLLQQRRRQISGDARRLSATELKGLLIHTADDLGTPGPDYESGWGLVNGLSANYVMTNVLNGTQGFFSTVDSVEFGEVAGASKSFDVPLEVTQPVSFKATLVWLDPAGPIDTKGSDPVLVHDLELRVIGPGGTEYFPFFLNGSNPNEPADTGINNVDNVEQVVVHGATTGKYEVQVFSTGSGQLPNQEFALWVSPVIDPISTLAVDGNISAAGGVAAMPVYSRQTWGASTDQTWATARKTWFSQTENAEIIVAPNLSPLPRVCNVVLRVRDLRGEISYTITQHGSSSSSISLAEALGEPTLSFTTSPDHPWQGFDSFAGDGSPTALSGEVGDDKASWVRHELEGPAHVQFEYYVSSEHDRDFFEFVRITPGSPPEIGLLSASGIDSGWQSFSTHIPAGNHILEWRYRKDASDSQGLDRAGVRSLKINRLTLTQNAASIAADSPGVTVPFSTRHPAPVLARFQPHWLTTNIVASGVAITPAMNYSANPRTANFQIGSEDLGWQSFTITQEASAGRISFTDVVNPELIEIQTPDNAGSGWTGHTQIGLEGSNALVAADPPSGGPSQILDALVRGPGILYFNSTIAGDENDFHGFTFEGETKSVRSLPSSAPNVYRFAGFIGPGFHPIRFWMSYGGIPTFQKHHIVSGLEVIPFEIEFAGDPVPAGGGLLTLTLNGLSPSAQWELTDQISYTESQIIPLQSSGAGEEPLSINVGPDTAPGGTSRFLMVSLEGRPYAGISIPQATANIMPIAQAMDQPGLVFETNAISPPSIETFGQDALHADGRDAVVLGHRNAGSQFLQTQVTGPAVVSFDYKVTKQPLFNVSAVFRVDGLKVMEITTDVNDWQTYTTRIDEGSHFITWGVERTFFYIDRLRIERALDSFDGEERLVDSGAGVLNIPTSLTGMPDSEVPWLSVDLQEGILSIQYAELPSSAATRTGFVSIGVQRLRITQIRLKAVDTGYLTFASAVDADELLVDSRLSPLASHGGGDLPNAIRYLFSINDDQPFLVPEASAGSGGLQLALTTVNSEFLQPLIQVSTDLSNWSTFTREENTWSPPTGYNIGHIPQPSPYQLKISSENETDRLFLRLGFRLK